MNCNIGYFKAKGYYYVIGIRDIVPTDYPDLTMKDGKHDYLYNLNAALKALQDIIACFLSSTGDKSTFKQDESLMDVIKKHIKEHTGFVLTSRSVLLLKKFFRDKDVDFIAFRLIDTNKTSVGVSLKFKFDDKKADSLFDAFSNMIDYVVDKIINIQVEDNRMSLEERLRRLGDASPFLKSPQMEVSRESTSDKNADDITNEEIMDIIQKTVSKQQEEKA